MELAEDELRTKAKALAAAFHRHKELTQRIDDFRRELRRMEQALQARENEIAHLRNNTLTGWIAKPFRTIGGKWRLARERRLILKSGLFNPSWYTATYPDVKVAGIDPAIHYIKFGAGEGRNPGPEFDTKLYLERNPDAAQSSTNPLVHYLRHDRTKESAHTVP